MKPSKRCPLPGIYLDAKDCYRLAGDAKESQTSENIIDASDCQSGCAKNGVCVAQNQAEMCLNARAIAQARGDFDKRDFGKIGAILTVMGVAIATAVGLLVYCYCVKNKNNDDDYERVNDK